MNLPDSAVDSIQDGKAGQCVVLITKSAFKTVRYNKWFDNLRIVFVPDSVAPGTVTAISVQRKEPLNQNPPTNVFMTRMTFQALEGFNSAQAFAILTDSDNPTGLPGQRVFWSNSQHSVFFHGAHAPSAPHAHTCAGAVTDGSSVHYVSSEKLRGAECEFIGFAGDVPPLLISTDSYAALHACAFKDLGLSVEIFDVSFGGRLHLENCTFENLQMTRSPVKYVSTSLNDDVPCQEPFEDSFKYNVDDDDMYDIRPQPLDFDNPSAGEFVEYATLSDCLRPAHECAPFLHLRTGSCLSTMF